MTKIAAATSNRRWIAPPIVYDVTIPSSHRTHSTAKIDQSIASFQSHKKITLRSACAAPENLFADVLVQFTLVRARLHVCSFADTRALFFKISHIILNGISICEVQPPALSLLSFSLYKMWG
jgi:hypothetical protein